MGLVVIFLIALVSRPCCSRSVVEELSVVSVYTTPSTTAGTAAPLDVYHQIANNIAERITSPIYRFLGFGNSTVEEKTTKRPWEKIELLDDTADVSKPDIKPVDNDISRDRDVEELSAEALKKRDKKPEKITLFSNYLPANDRIEKLTNDSVEYDDDFFDFDEVGEEKPREGPFLFILELFGSMIALLWGGICSVFRPNGPC